MKIKYLLAVISSILLLSSCKKIVAEISPEYEGEWHSEITTGADGVDKERYFIINGEEGIFGQLCELAPLGHNCFNTFSGEAKFNFNKSKILIGPIIDQVELRIDEAAHINADGDWECTLTSHVYIRN